MNTIPAHQQRRIRLYLLICAMSVLFSGCQKDEDAFLPPDNNPNGKPILTQTIGIGGGSLEMDSLTLIVPPGAFTSDCKLEVFVSDAGLELSSPAVTQLYKIKGLPADLKDSLLIKLKYSGPLTDDTYICHGGHAYDVLVDSTFFGYDLMDCQESSGYLTGYFKRSIDPNDLKSSKDNAGLQDKADDDAFYDIFMALTKYRTFESPSSNITIRYPVTLDHSVVQKYFTFFEDFYQLLYSLGFNATKFEGLQFPRNFDFFHCHSQEERRNLQFRKNTFCVFFLDYFPDNELKIRQEAPLNIFLYFTEYMHMMNSRCKYGWFDSNIGRWLLYQCLDTIPPERHNDNSFLGLNEWYDSEYFIEYLLDNYGNGVLSSIDLLRLVWGGSTLQRICETIQKPVDLWLPDYFRSYLEGNIYDLSGESIDKLILQNTHITFKKYFPSYLTSQGKASYADNYSDLSAKIFYFDTDDDLIKESSTVTLKVNSEDLTASDYKLLVFSYLSRTKEINLIQEGHEISISNLKQMKDEGRDLLAMVVNCYCAPDEESYHYSTLKLDVERKEIEQLDITGCSIWLSSVNVYYKWDDGSRFINNVQYTFSSDVRTGGELHSVNESTYTAAWDYTEGYMRYWGAIEVIIDPETHLLVSIDFTDNESENQPGWNNNREIERRIKCLNVPLDNHLSFVVSGNNILNYLDIIEYRKEYYDNTAYINGYEFDEIATISKGLLTVDLW
ncbi:MAG: hypothetical protein JXB49_25100 [Bacteroidales bacterium]|nr:hypothetical protein [Bacteroidales bacterium]